MDDETPEELLERLLSILPATYERPGLLLRLRLFKEPEGIVIEYCGRIGDLYLSFCADGSAIAYLDSEQLSQFVEDGIEDLYQSVVSAHGVLQRVL
jgi:hypothetical protein